MIQDDVALTLRLAKDARDLRAAQRLRYEVFVAELQGTGPLVDHEQRLEADEFDQYFDHLLLIDPRRDPDTLSDVVGVYRLLPPEGYARSGRYYSESEFDLARLKASGRRLVELGRSCVHRDLRGGAAMFLLWNGLADYVLERGIEVLFGPASFHGTDPAALAQPLSLLHHFYRGPEALRVEPRDDSTASGSPQPMDLLTEAEVSRASAMAGIPALIKAYLRLGGFVSDGAWIDREFNTIDVCLVMDTARMSVKHRAYYTRKNARE